MRKLSDKIFTWLGLLCWRAVVRPHFINSIKVVIIEKRPLQKPIFHERWIRPSKIAY